jgi:hypothetical protein
VAITLDADPRPVRAEHTQLLPALSEDLGHAQVIWCDSPCPAASDPRADGTALVG